MSVAVAVGVTVAVGNEVFVGTPVAVGTAVAVSASVAVGGTPVAVAVTVGTASTPTGVAAGRQAGFPQDTRIQTWTLPKLGRSWRPRPQASSCSSRGFHQPGTPSAKNPTQASPAGTTALAGSASSGTKIP